MNLNRDFLSYLFGNKKGSLCKLPQSVDWGSLSFEERLLYKTLTNSLDDFLSHLDLSALNSHEIYHLLGFTEYLSQSWREVILGHFPNEWIHLNQAVNAESLTDEQLQNLFDFKNNEVSIFTIFKKDRKSPGKLFIRGANGEFLRNEDQSIWWLPVLAKSTRGLAFNHTNGQTPTGVYKIDSVMPEANNQKEFGKFRRLIIDYQRDQTLFIPNSHRELSYWQQAAISETLGRSLLRIHGTGTKNNNLLDPAFPMVTSSGCLTVKERDFLGLNLFNHQRRLLDKLMDSLALERVYENETKIQACLYVVDFGGKFQNIQFK